MMKPNLSKFLVGLWLVLLAAQIAGCGASAGIKPSRTTCSQFLQQTQALKSKAAYAFLSSQCKAVTSERQMQNYWTWSKRIAAKYKAGHSRASNFNEAPVAVPFKSVTPSNAPVALPPSLLPVSRKTRSG